MLIFLPDDGIVLNLKDAEAENYTIAGMSVNSDIIKSANFRWKRTSPTNFC